MARLASTGLDASRRLSGTLFGASRHASPLPVETSSTGSPPDSAEPLSPSSSTHQHSALQARPPKPEIPGHTTPAKPAAPIHICLCGGLSQVDSFDYKPTLETYHGKKFGGIESADVFFGQIGLLRQSDWAFRRRGEAASGSPNSSPTSATSPTN